MKTDPFIQEEISRQSAKNEKVIAWLRCAFALTILPDVFFVNLIPRLTLWLDVLCLAYFAVAFAATYRWAKKPWLKYVVMTADTAVVLYLTFADPTKLDPLANFVFVALIGCFLVIVSSLRLSKAAVTYVTGLVLLVLAVVYWRCPVPVTMGIAPVMIVLISGILSYLVLGMLSHLLADVSQKERLARFLSPEIIEHAARNPALLQLGGKKQSVTMLFADIRQFSVLAESHPPEEVVNLLNDYFRVATDVIFRYRGTLDKFIGDALMALFGAPLTHPDDADRAVQTALEMMDRVRQFNEQRQSQQFEPIRIGIGINTATVIAGNVGTERRMDYTVIGDGVNIAARLEKLTKQYDAKIIISENTYNQLTDKFGAVCYGDAMIEGHKKPVRIYGLSPKK